MTIRRDGCFSEDLDYFIKGWLAGFDQFTGQLVCIDDRNSEGAETLCDGCLAATNTPGQAYHQCVFAIFAQGRGVTPLYGR